MSLGSFINIFKEKLQVNYFERLHDMQMMQKFCWANFHGEYCVKRTANKNPRYLMSFCRLSEKCF